MSMSAATFVDPFMPLTEKVHHLAIPGDCTDMYSWIAYLSDGSSVAEYDAESPAGSWHNLDISSVTFVELLPIKHRCQRHATLTDGCGYCERALVSRFLHQHRLMVPEGGVAHFERRRDIREDGHVLQTWTVVGWQRAFMDVTPRLGKNIVNLGARNFQVGYYLFFDDFGRSFGSSDLNAV